MNERVQALTTPVKTALQDAVLKQLGKDCACWWNWLDTNA